MKLSTVFDVILKLTSTLYKHSIGNLLRMLLAISMYNLPDALSA